MDFNLSEQQELFKRTVKEFADREIAPLAPTIDAESRFPHETMRKLAPLGLLGLGIPSDIGGSDGDNVMVALANEEIARTCAATSTVYGVQVCLVNHVIAAFGNDDQKERFIRRLTDYELVGAYGLTEPGAGSDAASIQTRAVKDGDSYVINGAKQFISNGDQADVMILFATADPTLRTKGIGAFILDTHSPGFSVAKVENKLGIRGSSTAALHFDNVRVPAENILMGDGQGFKIAMQVLDWSRIGIAAQAVGIAQAGFDASVRYAKQRQQFGKKIAEFQAIQWMIADMAVQIDAARLLTLRAASLLDEGKPYSMEASMAKLFSSEICEKVTSKAIQVHGGYGYIKDSHVERFYRDGRITQIYEGTSEVQRLVISRKILS